MKVVKIIPLFLLISCSWGDSTQELSDKNRTAIKKSAKSLVSSLSEHDFSVFRKLWSETRFKFRIKNLTKSQKSVLKWYLDKRLAIDILNRNNEIVTNLSLGNGRAKISRVQHYPGHSEVVVSFTYGLKVGFIKYRFEVVKERPVISDFFVYNENEWFSTLIKNTLDWNSKNNAYSEGRRELWKAISLSNGALESGDTLTAIRLLDSKIVNDFTGNGLIIKKLNLAIVYDPFLFEEMLLNEVADNQTLYMKYILAYHKLDSAALEEVCDQPVSSQCLNDG